ncbi:MAG: 16S rRNA endonuclease CdiA [Acinetobacter bereziniae]|uniref:16S rRNA endonuclease CdiA n=1 Tax=Acinetobacter bereziniae TaxID=106648 RepID=A0A833PE79_ACIBZ|nr:MAG: 16S rRNA endonuclease CdiA [Acinetobacter bereziniae]
MVTGSNTISDDLSSITPNQDNSTTPTFALDVKALGGMYANNIFIIGTDKGLGVSNAGTIQSPQTLVITSAGKIENTGAIQNTNPQDSLLSISTGDGADLVSSGSMITNGNLFLESGQNIILDKARLEKHGADNQNIISVSAKGDVSLQNSTNVQNFGEGGNLYIDASNINLGNDINIGVNGSIFLDAKQNLNATAVRNISSIYDINLSGGDLLTLNNTPVWANSGNINLGTTKQNSNLAVNSTSLNAEKDLNIYGAGTVSINQIGLDNVGATTKTKNFNISAQDDLSWKNAGNYLPVFTGKLDLRSNGKLDISGTQFLANEGINLFGKELIINSQLKSNKDINLTSFEKDLNLNQGANLSAATDINVSAFQGHINAKNLKANSTSGKASFISYGNNNIQSEVTGDTSQINAQKGITIASTGSGDVNISLTSVESTLGGVKVQSTNNTNIKDTNIKAQGNVEIFANQNLVLSGVNSDSSSHTALNANKLFINSSPDFLGLSPLYSDKSVSQLKSDGILSITNKDGSLYAQNLKLIGGATLIESGNFVTNKSVEVNATGSEFLRSNPNLNSLDGDLSIQSDYGLRIDPKALKLNATGDIDLISKNGATALVGYAGTNGQGSEEVVNLTTNNGGITL